MVDANSNEYRPTGAVQQDLIQAMQAGDLARARSLFRELEVSEARERESQRVAVTTAILRAAQKLDVSAAEPYGGVTISHDFASKLWAVRLGAPRKAQPTGNGSGRPGRTKAELGLSLGDLFERFATPEERAAEAAAASNSAKWQVRTRVKARVVKEGLLGSTPAPAE